MICKNCGTDNKNENKFCEKCGADLNEQFYSQPNYVPHQPQQAQAPFQNGGQPDFQQNQYQQNPYPPQNGFNLPTEPTPSVGKYILWSIVASLAAAPTSIVFFIIEIVFACDKSSKSRSNYFKAALIMKLIVVILAILLVVIIAAAGLSFSTFNNILDDYSSYLSLF